MAPICRIMSRNECGGCMDCEKPAEVLRAEKEYISAYFNRSGFYDPTAGEAITSVDNERKRQKHGERVRGKVL